MTLVLVIEDEEFILENLIEILKLESFDALGARAGLTGLQMVSEHRPDLVICDIRMPEFNGFEVLERLRRSPATANIPFIFVSARADEASVQEGQQRGANDYLIKPFGPVELLATIKKWVTP